MKVPFSKRRLTLHLLFSEIERDSLSAIELRIESISSELMWSVSMFSFSKYIEIFSCESLLTISRQSAVFLAKRLIDLVITLSILPSSQSFKSLCSSSRLAILVPLMPSS